MTNQTNLKISITFDLSDIRKDPREVFDDAFEGFVWQLPSDADFYIKSLPDFGEFPPDINLPPVGGGGDLFVMDALIPLLLEKSVVVASILALQKVINKLIERHATCEITIEKEGKKVTIKGQKISNPNEIIGKLFDDMDIDNVTPQKSRAEELRDSFSSSDLPEGDLDG